MIGTFHTGAQYGSDPVANPLAEICYIVTCKVGQSPSASGLDLRSAGGHIGYDAWSVPLSSTSEFLDGLTLKTNDFDFGDGALVIGQGQ